MSSVLDTLQEREFVQQVSHSELGGYLAKNAVTVYAGFDPTADSLHLGHLVPVMALAHFQRAGHRAVAVVGGATGLIGDPSGRSSERNLLTVEEVRRNASAIREQLGRFLAFDGDHPAAAVNNYDWISPLSFIDWLRDVGKHFSLTGMLNKESVRKRISATLSEHDVLNWPALLNHLTSPETQAANRVADLMHPQFLAQAAGALSESAPSEDAKAAVVTGLNDVLRRREFYAGPAFGEAELPAEAQRLLDKGVLNLFVTELEFLNRHLLEYALPGCLAAHAAGAEGISFTEFSYQTMQAYDFLQLHRDMNCTVQVGGSDQWGNITAGIDLIRRIEGAEAYGLTVPLMKTASGEKFGKSAGNAVWLDPERTSPYEFYQYWMRTDDRDVERFMKTFTFLPVEEIREIAAAHREHPERREGQRRLAEEVTRMAHGQEALEVAQKASQVLFGQEIAGFADAELRAIFADVPSATFERSRLEEGLGVVELLGSTVCNSNGEARRLIKNGGAYLNNRKVADPNATVTPDDLASESFLVLRSGKKRYHLVQFD